MTLTSSPVACAEMLIRKPVAEVFEAFIDPAITARFWFTRGSGRVTAGEHVTWTWDMYSVSVDVAVTAVEVNRLIRIEWPTPVEWEFRAISTNSTFVRITASGFTGSDDEQVAKAIDSMGGFSLTLAACKALLEHGIELNLVADHNPDAHVSRGA
jgi:uncharacterized protein YndB with AHSA1/START domain